MLDNPETGLDALHLAALRKCDDVVFCHREGKSYIRAVKRARQSAADPFAQDVTVEIECAFRWTDYARDGISYPVPCFDGFEMIGNYDNSAWRTTANLLRKGDRLTLDWAKDCQGSSGTIAEAGLHWDMLTLRVGRGTDQRLCFHIDRLDLPEQFRAHD